MLRVGLGGVMGTMNASSEAQSSGTGGWFDAITYIAGLSGGSWGTATFIANGGQLPTDLIDNVSGSMPMREGWMDVSMWRCIWWTQEESQAFLKRPEVAL